MRYLTAVRKTVGIVDKLVVVVLSLAAVVTGLLWLASQAFPYEHRFGTPPPNGSFPTLSIRWSSGLLIINYHTDPACVPSSQIAAEQANDIRTGGAGRVVCGVRVRTYYIHLSPRGIPQMGNQGVLSRTHRMAYGAWAPAMLLFGWYPAIRLTLCIRRCRRRRRRRRDGLCLQCGYSLFGLKKQRCPECGTEFEPSIAPKDPTKEG